MMDCGLGEMDTNMSFDCGVFAGAFDTMESGGDAEPRDVVFDLAAEGLSPINSEGTPTVKSAASSKIVAGGDSKQSDASSKKVVSDDDSARSAPGSIFSGGARRADINEDYELHAEIGAGHFGRVYECLRLSDGVKFACKQLSKRHVRDALTVRREVEIMRRLDHAHIPEQKFKRLYR